jgi:signal transduction histidine kinase/CheY-like chemotaxis protein
MSKKLTRAEMSDPQDRLAMALEAAGHGAWLWNLDDGSAWYSSTFRKILGFSHDQFADRFESFASHVHPDDIGRVHHAVATHLDGESEFDLEFKMRTNEQRWRWVRVRGRIVVEEGQSNVMMGTMTEWPLSAGRDRLAASASDQLAAALHDQSKSSRELEKAKSDLQNQNQDLQHAREKAEAAATSMSLFLANMSHEIRTPMTAILGFAEVLSEEQANPADQSFAIGAIRRSSENLLTIINDILDLSKIEAGGMGVEIVPCAPLSIIQDVVALMQVQALAGGLELFMELKAPVPEMIETDPTRLRQILINLIGNAIKFTKHGGVKVVVDLTKEKLEPRIDQDSNDAPPEDIRLRIQVMDTGIGINDAQRNKLFQRFTQADPSTTRRFGGTGLGLTISRHFSRMLGGNITSSSEVGLGSVFTVEVGIGNASSNKMVSILPPYPHEKVNLKLKNAAVSNNPTQSKNEITVLVAEDGEDNQRLIVHHLSRAGIKVIVANNGLEAVDLAVAAQKQSRAPDVILMDMQMPIMDGYEATLKLRELGWRGAIVAITAHAMTGDRERCTQAGCDDYLTKPINSKALIQTVQKFAQIAADKAL